MVAASIPAATQYRTVFQGYVTSSMALLSSQLRTLDGLLPEELQARIWLTLGYALRLDQDWRPTRELLLLVASKMEMLAFWEEWLVFLEASITQCRIHTDQEVEAELSMHFGHLLQRMNRFTDAYARLQQAQRLFRALGQSGRAAIALARLANLARRQHAYADAAKQIESAFALLGPDDPARAYCCFVRGLVALDDHKPSQAMADLSQAEALSARSEDMDDRRLNALALLNLGRVYEQEQDYEQAEDVHIRAIAVLDTLNDPVNLAVAQLDLGIVYMFSNKLDRALIAYDQAEAILRHGHGSLHYLAKVYNNKGMLFDRMGDGVRAEESLRTAIDIFRGLGDDLERLNSETNLGIALFHHKDADQARCVLEGALAELSTLEPQTGAHVALRKELLEHLAEVGVDVP